MKKRVLSIILAVAMVLSVIPMMGLGIVAEDDPTPVPATNPAGYLASEVLDSLAGSWNFNPQELVPETAETFYALMDGKDEDTAYYIAYIATDVLRALDDLWLIDYAENV